MAKKLIKQSDLRRLMGEIKKQTVVKKKIESPLARYDKDQLICIVCETEVGNEAVWPIHLNSKKHRDIFSRKFKRKESVLLPTESEVTPKKASIAKEDNVLKVKVIKGILKNSSSTITEIIKSEPIVVTNIEETQLEGINAEKNIPTTSDMDTSELPEGFFDDPKLDAKVRNVDYKDPVEEEWLQFQKAIREESTKAQEIIFEDNEEATNERQLDEIDEQLRHWSRVVSLEKKKEKTLHSIVPVKIENDDEPQDDEDFDEYVDWRSKNSFLK